MKKEKIEKIIKTLEIKKLELEIEKEIENEIDRDRIEYHFNMIYGFINNEISADYSDVINDFIWTYFSDYEKIKEELKMLLDDKYNIPFLKKILNNVDLTENIFYNFNEICNISINDLLFLVNNLIDFFKNKPCCINVFTL